MAGFVKILIVVSLSSLVSAALNGDFPRKTNFKESASKLDLYLDSIRAKISYSLYRASEHFSKMSESAEKEVGKSLKESVEKTASAAAEKGLELKNKGAMIAREQLSSGVSTVSKAVSGTGSAAKDIYVKSAGKIESGVEKVSEKTRDALK